MTTTLTELSRDDLLYRTRLAEQTERFEDMLTYMKKIVESGQILSSDERNFLSVAYKNYVGSRRTSWRCLCSLEQKEKQKGSKYLPELMKFKKEIENELTISCDQLLNLLQEYLLQTSNNIEAEVFYLKMQGDYYRYKSEYLQGDNLEAAANNALKAYQSASDIASEKLNTTNPIRLGLALNFSVFYYEIQNNSEKACNLAKLAFDDAINDIEKIDESQYRDATTIMQLLRDNLTLWASEAEDDLEVDEDQQEDT